ncbi:MAG: ABC transporter ATP-binding protein [Lachnospiraceae bacterium]
MEAIRVEQLKVAYDDLTVIEDMNLKIPKGLVSVMIGANGCGKSTLLKTIARVIKPVRGEIYINGNNITNTKEKDIAKTVAFLPQGPVSPGGISIRELIAFGRYPHQSLVGGMSHHDQEVIDWALEETALTDLANRSIDNLSGGQRQRAWIAMTLAQETEIILLDEPTTYLDMSHQLEVLEVLQNLNKKQNKTIVIVLHELNNACQFGDHLIGMKKGKIICEGNPKEVITEETLQEIYGIQAVLQMSRDGSYPICVEYQLSR